MPLAKEKLQILLCNTAMEESTLPLFPSSFSPPVPLSSALAMKWFSLVLPPSEEATRVTEEATVWIRALLLVGRVGGASSLGLLDAASSWA